MPLLPESRIDNPQDGGSISAANRLGMAREMLQSRDTFVREAGAQMLGGVAGEEAITLLVKACADSEPRVVEGGLRGLVRRVKSGTDARAEMALLRILSDSFRVRDLFRKGGRERLGVVSDDDFDVRRLLHLSKNPETAKSRLSELSLPQSPAGHPVQVHRSQRLRSNPSLRALFALIRADPDLRRHVRQALSRRKEFIFKPGSDVPRTFEPFYPQTRRMTAFLSAVGTSGPLTELMNLVVDRTASRDTDALWGRLRREIPYVPEIVVGSGPHAANLCSTLATLRPHLPPLVVEKEGRTGGQFALTDSPAWLMNSRARPMAEDRLALPGRAGALNSLGGYAPAQEADLTTQSFAGQDRIALATRMSLFLSAYCATGTAVIARYDNTDPVKETRLPEVFGSSPPDLPPGGWRYLVALRNERTGETGFIATDAIIVAGGLGKPRITFDDRKSRKVASDEQAKAGRGEVSRYYDFNGFMKDAGKVLTGGTETVVVIGAGDSGRVAVESLLGYGPGRTGAVHTLDRVRKVVWLGQKSKTRGGFLSCERPRYHALALEFPREEGAGGDGNPTTVGVPRVEPTPHRAVSLRVSGDKALVTASSGEVYMADLVIDCSGFGDETATLTKKLAKGEVSPNAVPVRLASVANRVRAGTKLSLCSPLGDEGDYELTCLGVDSSGASRKSIAASVRRLIGRSVVSSPVRIETPYCDPGELGEALCRALRETLRLGDGFDPCLRKTVLPAVSIMVNGKRTPVARQEGGGARLYYVGPAAGIPADETGSTAVIPDNSVALWRHAEAVTGFAEHYFASLMTRREGEPLFVPEFARSELSAILRTEKPAEPLSYTVCVDSKNPTIYGTDTLPAFQIVLAEHLGMFRLPKTRGTKEESLLLCLTPEVVSVGDEPEHRIEARMEYPLRERSGSTYLRTVDFLPLLKSLTSDPVFVRIALEWGRTGCGVGGQKRTVEIPLAIRGRQLFVPGKVAIR